MAVNTLVTGMMVFRFLKVMGFKPTSVEQTLGSTGGNKFWHIMFIIIESSMALFAIQMVRVVLVFVPVSADQFPFLQAAIDFVIVINQMLNVIIITRSSIVFLIIFTKGIAPTIILVRVQMRLSFDDDESFKEAIESLSLCFNNPSSDPNTQQQMGSNNTSIMMALENTERNEDNNTPSDPITTLRRVGSGSSLSIQEIRRSASADIQVSFDNPPLASNPELEFTSSSAYGM